MCRQVVCQDPASKKLLIEVTSGEQQEEARHELEKQDGHTFVLNNLSANTKYTVAVREKSGDALRSAELLSNFPLILRLCVFIDRTTYLFIICVYSVSVWPALVCPAEKSVKL